MAEHLDPTDPPVPSDDALVEESPAADVSSDETSGESVAMDEEAGSSSDPSESGETSEPEKPKLSQEVEVEERSTCQRHVVVTVSREDVDRYLDKEITDLVKTAQVPGFRNGRAPRKLVQAKFRKEVAEKVKSELLVDSIAQVNEEEDFSAISEPSFDVDALDIPEEGPLTFEFDLEVRPQFDIPQWKGLKIERPVREFSAEDVTSEVERHLSEEGQLVPHDGPAEMGDYVTTNLTFMRDGHILSQAEEEVIRIRPVLSFRDGRIENFGELMVGVTADDSRQAEAVLGDEATDETLRGKTVLARFDVLEVKRLELPELTPQLLKDLGDFESEADLRDAVLDDLKRQLEYHQHRQVRQQVTEALTESADWDLPPELLRRQSERELERSVLELRRSGFSENVIRSHANEIRQNSAQSTAQALKEHFILERVAEQEEIEDAATDYEQEIKLIAAQRNETPRRVRARLEKSGGMDALRNQIIERKVIDLILEHAEFLEVPYEFDSGNAVAVDRSAGGQTESSIPEAQSEHPEPEPTPTEETLAEEKKSPSEESE